ncbi:hypothetical protein BASA62_007234 [Batrachochytrium salamandrivorans]|nr:hypothetical protein BASA62_007234 [Batrachochytrium salamandrivorans]
METSSQSVCRFHLSSDSHHCCIQIGLYKPPSAVVRCPEPTASHFISCFKYHYAAAKSGVGWAMKQGRAEWMLPRQRQLHGICAVSQMEVRPVYDERPSLMHAIVFKRLDTRSVLSKGFSMASTTRYTRFSSVSLSASVIAGLLCMAPIGTSAATEWSLWKDPKCTTGTPLVSKVAENQCYDVAAFLCGSWD